MDYQALAKKLVQRAKRKGADEAEVFLEISREASCRVRDGQVEDLTQATSKGAGIRVLKKGRLGFAFSSSFDPSDTSALLDRALALAEAAAPNRHNGLPSKSKGSLGKREDVGGLFDAAVEALPREWKISAALEMERAARAEDARVRNFESVGAGEGVSDVYLASSEGAAGATSGTYVYLYAAPVASDGQQLQTSYWSDTKRFLSELDSPEQVGREAARRAARMLGARKVPTQAVPVIFDPTVAASFVANVVAAANGDAVFKGSSFLARSLGKRIGPSFLTIVDDGLLPRGLATSPFDGEGVATQRTTIVEAGVLTSFLYDTFTARKARARSTGNAARSYRSLPGIGTHNLYLEPSTRSPADIVREVPAGLYVASMLGHGANIVTGEYSRGANGLWIERGELAYPVQEVTVAGTLSQMLAGIDAIGDDLTFRGATGAPTVRFAELTVSGV